MEAYLLAQERINTKKKTVSALKWAESRQKEVDSLFLKMYEDRVSEKITKLCHTFQQVPAGTDRIGRTDRKPKRRNTENRTENDRCGEVG